MEPEAKFEYYQDILKYIYKNNIDGAVDLLSNLPFTPLTSELHLLDAALEGLQYQRYDRAADAVQHLVNVFAPDNMVTAVLDECLKEIKLSQPDSIVIQQIEAHQRSKEPTFDERTHFPDLIQYSPAVVLTRLIVAFLALGILIQYIGLRFDRDERVLLKLLEDERFVSNASLVESDDQQQLIGYAYLGNYVIWFFPFLFWIRRRYKNLTAFGAASLMYSPTWAWLGFFIPILNIFKPHQVAQEIWQASDPDVNSGIADQWRNSLTSNFILLWWIVFLGTNFVRNVGSRLVESDGTIESLLAHNTFSHMDRALIIIQFTMTLVFVVVLSTRQQDKYDALLNVDQEHPFGITVT